MNLDNAIIDGNTYSWNIGMKTFRYKIRYTVSVPEKFIIMSKIEGVRQLIMPNIVNPECDYTFTTDTFTVSFTNTDPMNSPFSNFESLEITLIDV